MLKSTYTRTVILARPCFLAALAVCVLSVVSKVGAVTPGDKPTIVQQLETCRPALDTKRLFALGMIETGNDDRVVGAAGEVSRYQLSPSVWKSYSKSSDYQNPDVSLQVARQHWLYLAAYFKEKTGRTPDDFDMYALWNTRYGYYARKNFSKRQISSVVQDRAQRFVNLVNRKD